MLAPLQSTSGVAVSDLLRSIIDRAEERRVEDERKASGRREEDEAPIRKQQEAGFGFVETRANAKINEFFFGSLKQEADPRAKLISRFADALGLSREAEETDREFAQRLADVLSLVDMFEKTDSQNNATVISIEALGVTETDVTSILDGTVPDGTTPPDAASLAARYAERADLSTQDAGFSKQLSGVLTAARARAPESIAALEKSLGLDKLGISAWELVDAIGSPSSEAGMRLQAALDDLADEAQQTSFETVKILQRLEDVAQPLSLEELKDQRVNGRGSATVEDTETRAERDDAISGLEASEKLDDVIGLQDAIGQTREGEAVTGNDEVALIQVLANDSGKPADVIADEPATETSAEAGSGNVGEATGVTTAADTGSEINATIYPVRTDENGLYELLYDKAA